MGKSNDFVLIGALAIGGLLLYSALGSKQSDGGSSGGGGVLGLGGLVGGVEKGVSDINTGIGSGLSGLGSGLGGLLGGLGGIAAGAGQASQAVGTTVQAGGSVLTAGAGLLSAGANLVTTPVKGVTNVANKAASGLQSVGSTYATGFTMALNKVTTGNYITPTATLDTGKVNAALAKVGTKTSSDLTKYLKQHPGAPTSQVQAWLRP